MHSSIVRSPEWLGWPIAIGFHPLSSAVVRRVLTIEPFYLFLKLHGHFFLNFFFFLSHKGHKGRAKLIKKNWPYLKKNILLYFPSSEKKLNSLLCRPWIIPLKCPQIEVLTSGRGQYSHNLLIYTMF